MTNNEKLKKILTSGLTTKQIEEQLKKLIEENANKDKGNKMNEQKFYELVKTINDNIDMFNYIVTPDGKLVLVCELREGNKHFVKTWNNIKSHDEVIDERLESKQ